jgi:hypothetical protein
MGNSAEVQAQVQVPATIALSPRKALTLPFCVACVTQKWLKLAKNGTISRMFCTDDYSNENTPPFRAPPTPYCVAFRRSVLRRLIRSQAPFSHRWLVCHKSVFCWLSERPAIPELHLYFIIPAKQVTGFLDDDFVDR